MTKAKQTKQIDFSLKWYQKPRWSLLLIPVCLAGAYVFFSLALNSASLLEYTGCIALVVLAINRLTHVVLWGMGKGRIG